MSDSSNAAGTPDYSTPDGVDLALSGVDTEQQTLGRCVYRGYELAREEGWAEDARLQQAYAIVQPDLRDGTFTSCSLVYTSETVLDQILNYRFGPASWGGGDYSEYAEVININDSYECGGVTYAQQRETPPTGWMLDTDILVPQTLERMWGKNNIEMREVSFGAMLTMGSDCNGGGLGRYYAIPDGIEDDRPILLVRAAVDGQQLEAAVDGRNGQVLAYGPAPKE
ncbi:MAG: hypothetical protein GXP62_08740 [Oligoflexia bacterium]|nr:hypothetical protein [Oligoflexia bacterium]